MSRPVIVSLLVFGFFVSAFATPVSVSDIGSSVIAESPETLSTSTAASEAGPQQDGDDRSNAGRRVRRCEEIERKVEEFGKGLIGKAISSVSSQYGQYGSGAGLRGSGNHRHHRRHGNSHRYSENRW